MEQFNKNANCKLTSNQNFGYSTRLSYDETTYNDRLEESVAPLEYRLNTNRIYNCDSCSSSLGPRPSKQGYENSLPVANQAAVSQTPEMVNIESILTNRNVPASKNKKNTVNPIDVTQISVNNPRMCNDFLNPLSSRLTYPAATYRDMGINRFYDLNKNPQANIFYDFAENTKLEAIDNYIPTIPKVWSSSMSLPHELRGKPKCKQVKICPTGY